LHLHDCFFFLSENMYTTYFFHLKNHLKMKKVLIGLMLVSMGVFFACQKESLLSGNLATAEKIATATNKVAVNLNDLPTPIVNYVESNHGLDAVEASFHVPGAGYEVGLLEGFDLYFGEDGVMLDGQNGPRGRHPRPLCMRGRPVSLDSLPAGIAQYVAANFPADVVIEKAVQKRNGFFAVLLSNGAMLIFTAEGTFEKDCLMMPPPPPRDSIHRDSATRDSLRLLRCMEGPALSLDSIPAAVSAYVADNFTGAAIVRAVRKPHGGLAVELDNGKILMFGRLGEFLGECPLGPPPPPPGPGGHGPTGGGGHVPGGHGPGGPTPPPPPPPGPRRGGGRGGN
jgi:hypothetical protein